MQGENGHLHTSRGESPQEEALILDFQPPGL